MSYINLLPIQQNIRAYFPHIFLITWTIHFSNSVFTCKYNSHQSYTKQRENHIWFGDRTPTDTVPHLYDNDDDLCSIL